MNGLVERLAEKWVPVAEYGNAPCGGGVEGDDYVAARSDARWWLAAIAEELAEESALSHRYGDPDGFKVSHPYKDAARWLRKQAED